MNPAYFGLSSIQLDKFTWNFWPSSVLQLRLNNLFDVNFWGLGLAFWLLVKVPLSKKYCISAHSCTSSDSIDLQWFAKILIMVVYWSFQRIAIHNYLAFRGTSLTLTTKNKNRIVGEQARDGPFKLSYCTIHRRLCLFFKHTWSLSGKHRFAKSLIIKTCYDPYSLKLEQSFILLHTSSCSNRFRFN